MIPYKIFNRMTELLLIDAINMQSGNDRSAEKELDKLQEDYGWPQAASHVQIKEWNELYSRIDPSA